MKQDSKQQSQEFDSLNHYSSDLVETILVLLRKSDAEKALSHLEKGDVLLIEQAQIERYRKHLTAFRKNDQDLRELIAEIKEERDILLGSVNHLYQTFSFIFKAIEEARSQDQYKLSGIAKGLKLGIRAAGIGKLDDYTVFILERIVASAKTNMDAIASNFQDAGTKFAPALELLLKHNIIDPTVLNITTNE